MVQPETEFPNYPIIIVQRCMISDTIVQKEFLLAWVARVGSCVDAAVPVSTLGGSVFVQRETCRWPLLQSAPPKRLDIALYVQFAQADVCLQCKNDVVMTVQQLSVWAVLGFGFLP